MNYFPEKLYHAQVFHFDLVSASSSCLDETTELFEIIITLFFVVFLTFPRVVNIDLPVISDCLVLFVYIAFFGILLDSFTLILLYSLPTILR